MSADLTAETVQQRIRDYLRHYYNAASHGNLGALKDLVSNLEHLAGPEPTRVKVELYRTSGKYYTEEEWRIPDGAIGPHDMRNSLDFRRIDPAGVVVIPAQEPWGYPFVIMPGHDALPDATERARQRGLG